MWVLTTLLASTVLIITAACGSSAPGTATTTLTVDVNATPGAPATSAFTASGKLRLPFEMVVTIDSCTWKPEEAGGPVGLNLAFTVFYDPNSPGRPEVFTSFRVQNTTGSIYKPRESQSTATLSKGETVSRNFHTAKFPVESQDLALVISPDGRLHGTFPLDQCTEP